MPRHLIVTVVTGLSRSSPFPGNHLVHSSLAPQQRGASTSVLQSRPQDHPIALIMERGGASPHKGLAPSASSRCPPIVMEDELIARSVSSFCRSDLPESMGLRPRWTFILRRGREKMVPWSCMNSHDPISIFDPSVHCIARSASTPGVACRWVSLCSLGARPLVAYCVQLSLDI